MRSAWICVLSLAWSACASSAPVSGDVDDTALGLGTGDEQERERERDDDSPPVAAKPVVTCFDAQHGISVAVEARRPAEPAQPPHGSGGDSCDPGAPPHAGVEAGLPVPAAPRAPVLVVVERESGAVACGCGFGFSESVRGVAGVPPDAPVPSVPGVPPVPPVPASGGAHAGGAPVGAIPATAAGSAHAAAGGGPDAPGVPGVPGAPVITVTVSSGAPGEPAKIVPPPSCDALIEQCYADDLPDELCEELADCCANTPAPV